jgi:hypothetical protein
MFKSYCKQIAELEERTEEYRSLRMDDGGLNSFERENLSKILSRRYVAYDDASLVVLGDRLRYYLISAYTAGVCYLATSIYIGTYVCR